MQNTTPFYKTNAGLIALVIAAIVIGGLIMYGYQTFRARPILNPALTVQPATQADNSAQETIINKSVGDEVVLQLIKFRVNQVTEKTSLNGILGVIVADAGVHFTVVNLTVTSLTNENITVGADDVFRLVDDKGRHFTAYNNMIGHVDNYFQNVLFAPNIPKTVNMVFELPNDATGYYITVGKGGTNDIYRVKLK